MFQLRLRQLILSITHKTAFTPLKETDLSQIRLLLKQEISVLSVAALVIGAINMGMAPMRATAQTPILMDTDVDMAQKSMG